MASMKHASSIVHSRFQEAAKGYCTYFYPNNVSYVDQLSCQNVLTTSLSHTF